ncbi:probable pectinesterase/pectinesterase inhibitor 20 [Actinidia eriantha]|uniref:probable pectinesterase/pectinesterase inhibitor 20 n=1 Tax=Actinidia eriantha TaxID=165200 RepID=UPI0025848B33|nr:probable pectinesterase/pectinesterase inhibitor 20 [Actinidia eriantha]
MTPMHIFILSLFLIIPLSTSSTPTYSPEGICNSTPFPSFCKTLLPNNNSATVYDYGRFSIHRSLATTQNFLSLIDGYLKLKNTLPQTTVRALEDCQFLISLNLDFLSNTIRTIDSTSTLQSSKAEDMHTLLSAILTNQQTCSDGLQSTSLQNALSTPFKNGNMLYSVSLALFRHGWVHDTRKGRWLRERMKITQDRSIYEAARGRKLLQTGGGNVKVSQIVTVRQDGGGNFTAIGDAVAAAPNNTAAGVGYYLIYVVAGVYEEYISIAKNKQYVMVVGDGINRTIITGNRSVVDGWTTFNSATFAVVGQGFVAMNLTIRNTAGAAKHQAVALRSGADLSTFYNCSFEGYQDTLYTHSLRQFYRDCDIYGTVDFIFGNAAVVLQNCNLYPRLPMQGQFNAITAQGRTDINQNTGTSIQNCSIRAAPDLASSSGTTNTYLGRPWKEYSRTVYMQNFMDSLIDPAGWIAWSGDFALNTSYYAEYANRGPGSSTANRVTWPGYHVINATDAANFTVSSFVSGDSWLPATRVPYTAGLM